METRANHIIVGMFALLMLFGALGFTLWIGSQDDDMELSAYEISFEESVKGLSVNSDVLFIGIRVGRVTNIKISDITPGAVRVRVAVAADTPVRKNSTAKLEMRGITGAAVISISGGTADSPLIQPPEDAVAEIPTEPSALSSMFAHMPEVLNSAHLVLENINKVFSKENIAAVNDIVASLQSVSQVLEKRSESLNNILTSAESMVKNMDSLAQSANTVMLTDFKETSRAMSSISGRVDATLKVMDPGLRQFSTTGLAEMRMLIVEMRHMVHLLTRVGQNLESDPRRFFFGDQTKEFQSR